MSFSYGIVSGSPNPPIDYVRLLVSDTQEFAADGVTRAYIWDDAEILAATNIQSGVFQSSQFYSGGAGATLPTGHVSYLRVAALLLDALAASRSRLSSVVGLLDVKLDVAKAADALRAQAAQYRQVDDDSGAFAIIEQCPTTWSVYDRFWAQVQRSQGTGL